MIYMKICLFDRNNPFFGRSQENWNNYRWFFVEQSSPWESLSVAGATGATKVRWLRVSESLIPYN